ncbi:M42 family metallopeptidase [Aestuariivirga sp.]|uniref:M42 family metallopeptidase n=1 Tax=Aestuariivirga sp. TaxID=2650926 RepID=UPI00359412E8
MAHMQDRIKAWTKALMMIPGLSGYEGNVRRYIKAELHALGLATRTDRLGNLIATIAGDDELPSVMFIAHMDQLGLIVRKIEANGLIRVERLGGVPEKALPAQEVLLCVGHGRTIPGVIANKSHHATTPEEKYKVTPYPDLYIDCGFESAAETLAAGINVGTPIVYAPNVVELAGTRLAGTSIDDRAACAIQLELARELSKRKTGPAVHLVFSVQEEFNLRGAITAAQVIEPDICIQLDLALATDTPDMGHRGDVRLGAGPVMGMYSFHGRGTLNGCLPHPAMVKMMEDASKAASINLQRSAHIGALTETSYVQLVGQGVACIDMGFPARYTHSALEVCDLADLESLTLLLIAAVHGIDASFSLDRDDYIE